MFLFTLQLTSKYRIYAEISVVCVKEKACSERFDDPPVISCLIIELFYTPLKYRYIFSLGRNMAKPLLQEVKLFKISRI